MQRLEVSVAVRPIYGSLGVKRLSIAFIAKFHPYQGGNLGPKCRSGEMFVQRTVLLWDHTARNSVLPESRQPLASFGVQTYQRLLLETAGDRANE